MNEILWSPSENQIYSSRMTHFQKFIESKTGRKFPDYRSFHQWSVESISEFWALLWEYIPVQHSESYSEKFQKGKHFWESKFFSGAKLNFAENLLRGRQSGLAIQYKGENGFQEEVTYKSLSESVAALASYLKSLGVVPGDRVVGLMPNLPSAVISMLAATSLGAIWSSCSPDFGTKGVLDRFGQIRPKVLITSNEYEFKGKIIQLNMTIREISDQLKDLEKIIVVGYPSERKESNESRLKDFPKNSISWEEAISARSGSGLEFVQLPFDHPVYIMYSSGTTGLPKCMVQGSGVFLNHWKELALHTDLNEADRIFFYTTCGWMMWNWLVSSLSIGATIQLFDGNPFYPSIDVLFQLAEELKTNVFGVGAKYILSLEKEKWKPTQGLNSLRTVLSTGSPLPPYGFKYVYESWKKDIRLSSISGGTDLNGCFALGNPNLPVRAGELQCVGLGMAVEIWNESGNSVSNEKGELVCTKPFPSMPLYFWDDADGEKYRKAYFDVFPEIWRHGDFAEFTSQGGMMVFGRSDATLNPGGVRIGTADLYSLLETIPEIADSVVIGQDWKDDVRVVLFLKMASDKSLTKEFESYVRKEIREKVSPRHVPAKILSVPDIPYTRNLKKVEIAVKKAVQGETILNKDALANPESLEYFSNLSELKVD
ncbi:acetoacetate--CoA ligase [Leptospira perolatii]|uniref:Acetoacetate--CoA ligase n=1 Tax=Leptospira perolatii TaxID=2023191 RepID=A0A2M9ZIX8_9LEPT|nr:acetoacetate--CoA ligase [Leptospira perolatii]PJZ68624.1 acetoacetate--CoA ligase [Leptospira perolatii]PJZ71971.1 acetoacetate--CoA ligase [Leptospira perolatii]